MTVSMHPQNRAGAARAPAAPDSAPNLPPNWFATVMGTGIIAIAADGLPWQTAVLRASALVFWLLTCAVFIGVVGATVWHWHRYPHIARGYARHCVVAHFYGAVPMAVMTVGTSTLVVGTPIVGPRAALAIDLACWTVGTVGAVLAALVIPYRHLLRSRVGVTEAFGGWLMPVVAPMVSASAAAMLVGRLDAAWARSLVLGLGYAMFVLAVVGTAPILFVLGARLRTGEAGPASLTPTWWIVLGPLGQSVTAILSLGHVAPQVFSASTAGALHDVAVGYGLIVWTAATLWIGYASRLTVRAIGVGMPFGLTWWSFTFPVGTYVTGSTAMASTLGWAGYAIAAVCGFAVLLGAWTVVAVRTVKGAVTGDLVRASRPS